MSYFDEPETIKWPCVAHVPKKDGSKRYDAKNFKVEFNLLTQEEIKAAPTFNPSTSTADEIMDAINKRQEIAVNNIVGFDIAEISYSAENLIKVLNKPPYFKAITNAFWEAQNGKQ